jgi:hypothetical protein
LGQCPPQLSSRELDFEAILVAQCLAVFEKNILKRKNRRKATKNEPTKQNKFVKL